MKMMKMMSNSHPIVVNNAVQSIMNALFAKKDWTASPLLETDMEKAIFGRIVKVVSETPFVGWERSSPLLPFNQSKRPEDYLYLLKWIYDQHQLMIQASASQGSQHSQKETKIESRSPSKMRERCQEAEEEEAQKRET